MSFNLRGFLRFTGRWFSQLFHNRYGWTPRRVAIMLAFYLFYPPFEMAIWLGLWLDRLLFPKYRQLPVKGPVFVVGNPRSGTTFLHRLLARDRDHFSTMNMWEILFAPSISGRKFVKALAWLDLRLGGPIHHGLDIIEKGWQTANVMHRLSLRIPEEDDYLLLHIWSALTTGLSAGLLDEARLYTYFDTAVPRKERERVMAFYRDCVQRHLYAHPEVRDRHYLAKNPSLSPKLGTVLDYFADAKIIYLVRSPLEMVPSYTDMMDFTWEAVGIADGHHDLHDYVLDMAAHWYTYPLEQLDHTAPQRYIVIRYDDLVADPEQTIIRIYQHFGFDMSPEFARVLHAEKKKASTYHSRHDYSLKEQNLDRDRIVERCGPVLQRFHFDDTE